MIMLSYNVNNRVVMQEETITKAIDLQTKYELSIRGVGSYATDSLAHMWWVILCHRLHHFVNGEGFCD